MPARRQEAARAQPHVVLEFIGPFNPAECLFCHRPAGEIDQAYALRREDGHVIGLVCQADRDKLTEHVGQTKEAS